MYPEYLQPLLHKLTMRIRKPFAGRLHLLYSYVKRARGTALKQAMGAFLEFLPRLLYSIKLTSIQVPS
jgi:hypothetical protein